MDSHDPFDIRGNESQREEKETRERIAKEVEEADVKWLMSSKRGRRIVWRLLDQSGVFRLSFNPDLAVMAFAEGNRNFGNRMLTMVHTLCPELYPTMVKEQQDVRIDAHGTTN